MFNKTLICLDGSKLAEEILRYIVGNCPVPDSEVTLLRIFTANITIPPPESAHVMTLGRGAKPDQMRTTDIGKSTTLEPKAGLQLREIEREQGEAKSYLEGAAGLFRTKGIKVKTVVLQGEPAETILNYAISSHSSLIALTTHGSSGVRSGTLGKVAQYLLKESEIPVLIVKPTGKGARP